jgi:hypothetical protein
MITFIKRTELQELDKVVSKMNIDSKTSLKILKYVKQIKKKDNENSKYGSNWLDVWFMNRDIFRLNRILKSFLIIVV